MLKKSLLSLLLLMSMAVNAGEGLDQLQTFTSSLRTLKADFTQTLFDEKMQQIEVANGVVHLQKPGKFRWDYTRPYEQTIVADGEKLWVYDIDLDQVTVKPLQEALGSTPILLLTSDQPLKDQFNVIELGLIDGRQFLQLEAKVKDTEYGYLLLALGQQGLEVMELKDKLGNVTRIEFNNKKINSKISPEQFVFIPPENADVVGQ